MKSEDFIWDWRNPYEWMARATKGLPPLIISVAITGGVQGKEAHENLPETPEEQAEQTKAAYDAGASIVHVHARNPEVQWMTSANPEDYLKINGLIRAKCPDIIINNTTGGGPTTTMEQRYRCLDAMPEIASLNLGPDMSRFNLPKRPAPLPNPHDGFTYDECIPFSYGIIEKLVEQMNERGIKPEMELYHPGQYWVSSFLMEKKLINPPYAFQYVMGYQTSSFPTPSNLLNLVTELPDSSLFFAIGIGPHQLPMNTLAIVLGGHVRVGLEDNLYYRRDQKLTGNGQAVERVVRIAKELNRDVATPAQARKLLGVSDIPSSY